jgi:hypothetical protein
MVVMLTSPLGIGGLFGQVASDRSRNNAARSFKRLLLGVAAVGLVAVCTESAQRLGRSALLEFVTGKNAALWLVLVGLLGVAMFVHRRWFAGSSAPKGTLAGKLAASHDGIRPNSQ